MLATRGARDWTGEDVLGWFDRASRVEGGRSGLQVASRTDRAVFRFILPRVIELMATGALPANDTSSKVFVQFQPGQVSTGNKDAARVLERYGALVLDRALQDADWPLDVISVLRLLACGGWTLPVLVQQALDDPELQAGLSRAWARTRRSETLFPGVWPTGAISVLRAAFVTPLMVERMMNFAMAEGTSPSETDAAMRSADLLLRNL